MHDLKHEAQMEVRGILIRDNFSTRVKRVVADDDVDLYRLKLSLSLEAT